MANHDSHDLASKNGNCVICTDALSDLVVRGELPCKHDQFCLYCITRWSSQCPRCPMCNETFDIIKPTNAHAIQIIQAESASEWIWSSACQVCGGEDYESAQMTCISCLDMYHYWCVGLMDRPNLEKWYCPGCIERQRMKPRLQQAMEERQKRQLPIKRQAEDYEKAQKRKVNFSSSFVTNY